MVPGQRINFYDDGGPTGNYIEYTYANWYHTFTADTGTIQLTFTQFITEQCCDYIIIYDGVYRGSGTVPPILFNGSQTGVNNGNLSSRMPMVIPSTGNTWTVFWHTDGSVVAAGWTAFVTNNGSDVFSNIVKEYDILLDATTNEQVTIVSPEDVFGFYDDGGSSGAYSNAVGNFTLYIMIVLIIICFCSC